MNAVDPIKSLDDIRKMKEFLAKKPRNALLFSFGINSGLKISDILALNNIYVLCVQIITKSAQTQLVERISTH